MAALNLTLYCHQEKLIYQKARAEAEEFIARWNAAECSQGNGMSVRTILPRETMNVAKQIHETVTHMMYSSGFIIKYEYKTKNDGVHVKARYTTMTPELRAMLKVLEEKAMESLLL